MHRIMSCALLLTMLLLVLGGCKQTTPYQVFCSMNGDGTGFKQRDHSLGVSSLGRPFYVTDSMVFHLGSSLIAHDLLAGTSYSIIPASLIITDKKNLAIDMTNQLLYFAADNAIWKVGFNGGNLSKLSPENGSMYSAPVLSPCGKFLSAIKDQRIARLNLQSGVWIELAAPVTAEYAVYYSDLDEYYYFSVYELNYRNNVSLCKTNAALQDSTLLMGAQYAIDYDGALLLLRSSRNHRYLAMHTSLPPQRIPSYFTDYYWERYTQTLMVYDTQTGTTHTIPACYGFSLVENTDQLYYSRAKYGMADLMCMDLTTGQSVMVWDGYYAPNQYSYSIDEIFPRFDGQKVHLKAWRRAQYAD